MESVQSLTAPLPLNRTARRAPQQDRARQRVERLLDAAADVLREVGYAKATTNRIAKAAGVPIGSLYQYFDSKEALVADLIERRVARQLERLRLEIDGHGKRNLAETVAAVVRALIAIHRQDPDLQRILAEEVPRSGRLKNQRTTDIAAIGLIQEFLEGHRAQLTIADLPTAAFVVMHAVEAIVLQAVNYRRDLLSSVRLEAEATRLVLAYLTASA